MFFNLHICFMYVFSWHHLESMDINWLEISTLRHRMFSTPWLLWQTGKDRCFVLQWKKLWYLLVKPLIMRNSTYMPDSQFNLKVSVFNYWFVLLAFRRKKVKELSTVRKNNLANSLLYATFNRDVAEVGDVDFWVVPIHLKWYISYGFYKKILIMQEHE